VVDQFWGGGEEEAHQGGLSAVEGINGGEKTPVSWSRGHRLGHNGWGGNTRWCDTWGGFEVVGEGLEWAVCGGLATASKAAQGR
jgi:hypothetical protein